MEKIMEIEDLFGEALDETLVKLAQELAGYAKNQKLWKADQKRIRKIGETLDGVGGFDMMYHVHGLFSDIVGQRRSYPRLLEFEWDSIGSWQC